jgi:hypothetical protein
MGLVQTKQGSAASGSLTITLDAPTTAGNALIVILASSGTSTNPTSVSSVTLGGSAGNFASVSTFGSASDAAIGATWLDLNCVGGQTSVVITMTGGTGTIATLATVYEWSGLVSASAFDKTSGGVSAGATTWSSGATAAVSQPSELLIGGNFVTVSGSTPTITGPSSPWNNLTQVAQVQGTFNDAWMSGYQVVSSGGTATYSGTVSPSSQSISQVNTFKLLVVEPVPLAPLFLPVDSPLYGLAPWEGAPDSDHSVIVNAGTASISFQSPATRPFLLLALTSETGPGATAITRDDPYALLDPLLTPDDVTGGMAPWTGAPDSVTSSNITATAGVASVTFTGLAAAAGLGVVPGTGTVSLTAQAPVSGLSVLPGTAAITLTAQAPLAGLSVLPGTSTVALAGQNATAGLGVVPGTGTVTVSGQSATSGLGALPGVGAVSLGALSASTASTEGTYDSSPVLFLPDDLTSGMDPWMGAPDSLVPGATTATAGVASVTFTALNPAAGLSALPGTGAVALTAQAPAAGLGALPGTGTVALTAQAPATGLGVVPGTGTVSLTAQAPAAGLGALPGTAMVTTSVQQDAAGLGALPSAAPVAFASLPATVSTLEDPQALPLQLLLPDDVAGGMLPWGGAPQGIVTGDTTVLAGVATMTVLAQSPSTALAVGTGTGTVSLTAQAPASGLTALPGTGTVTLTAQAPASGLTALPGTGTVSLTARTPVPGLTTLPGTGTVSLTAQNPSAAFSGTATPGTATVTMTARSASTALAVLPSSATVAVSAPTPAAGLGALAGTATIGLTAVDPTVVLPQAAHGRTISGREGSTGIKGREPVSSRSGEEPDADISGREA